MYNDLKTVERLQESTIKVAENFFSRKLKRKQDLYYNLEYSMICILFPKIAILLHYDEDGVLTLAEPVSHKEAKEQIRLFNDLKASVETEGNISGEYTVRPIKIYHKN